jgi:hypothetical protein
VDFRTTATERTLRGVNTARRRRLLLVASLVFASAITACGANVTVDDEGGGAEGGAAPLTCDLEAGPIDLVPLAGNPPQCRGVVSCEVWFGHGQHLSCPYGFTKEPAFVECDIWDCLCSPFEEDDFVANFATGEVVDTRDPNVTCRYTLTPAQ